MAACVGTTILDVHTSRLNGCCWQMRRPAPDGGGTLRAAAATPFRACRDTRAENDMSDQKNRDFQLFRYLCCFRLGMAFICLFVSLSFGAPSPLPWYGDGGRSRWKRKWVHAWRRKDERFLIMIKETERSQSAKGEFPSFSAPSELANLRICLRRFLCSCEAAIRPLSPLILAINSEQNSIL